MRNKYISVFLVILALIVIMSACGKKLETETTTTNTTTEENQLSIEEIPTEETNENVSDKDDKPSVTLNESDKTTKPTTTKPTTTKPSTTKPTTTKPTTTKPTTTKPGNICPDCGGIITNNNGSLPPSVGNYCDGNCSGWSD